MLASFVIGFRESLEAALIVGVILAYLNKTNRTRYNYLVYIGIASAVLMSIILALIFNSLVGDFKGIAGELFEGSVMLLASIILTYVILWMMKQRHIRDNLEHKIDVEIKKKHKIGLFSLSFIAVLREGAETILFL